MPEIPTDTIISKELADAIQIPLDASANVQCDYIELGEHPTSCVDRETRPKGKPMVGWHQAKVSKMCASCACYWHLSCARNFALGVVR